MLTTMKLYLLLLVTWRVQESKSQEVSTPSSQLKPRNFNHHSLLNEIEPTKQGPVLFPNDAPPPPRPPLIVTSRPLVESIARSELAENNTVTSQSQDRVAFLPFLARVKDYRPYRPSPTFDYQFAPTQIPYADLVKKSRFNNLQRDNRYDDYEEQTVLPPIYKALSDHAKQKVLKIQQKKSPAYIPHYNNNNDIQDDNNSEYDQNQNYAFSYTVKDHKTGDDFSHSQHSSGSATNGEYRVRLPDGRMQIVSYTADENGYKADVRYDEETNTIENNNKHNVNKQNYFHNRHNDYVPNEHNNYALNQHRNHQSNYYVTPTQQSFADKHYVTPVQHYEQNDNSYRQTDYIDRSNNHKYDYVDTVSDKDTNKDRDYYQYPENTDLSKEYYNDYSSEYNSNNEPHKSKFNFANKNYEIMNKATASSVKPSYEELKHLFVTKTAYDTQNNYDPVELKAPSTTPLPYEGTTERVVHIGGRNLYTNIKHSLGNPTPVPVSYSTPKFIVASTPRSYLVSTIANLKNKVSLVTKPVLSDNFISKINKYINYNK